MYIEILVSRQIYSIYLRNGGESVKKTGRADDAAGMHQSCILPCNYIGSFDATIILECREVVIAIVSNRAYLYRAT